MSRPVIITLALYAAIVLQPLLNESLAGCAVALSLPALAAALAMFLCGPAESLLWAGVAGLMSDALRAPPLGLDMLCLTATVFAVRRATGPRLPGTVISAGAVTAVATFCAVLGSTTARGLLAKTPLVPAPLLSLALRPTLGNAIAAMLAALAVRTVHSLLPGRRPARSLSHHPV